MVLYCTILSLKKYQSHFKVTTKQLEEGGRLCEKCQVQKVSSVQKVKMSKDQEVLELPKAEGAKDARVYR